MNDLFRSAPRRSASYGDVGNQRQQYEYLRGMSRREILSVYGDAPEGLAVAIRYAFDFRLTPNGADDLSTVHHFFLADNAAGDSRVRSFLDSVMPGGDPNRCRLPLVHTRRDFGEILSCLVRMDAGYYGRVLLMRAFLVLAKDNGLFTDPSR